MKVLDIDMDYFLNQVASGLEERNSEGRLPEEYYEVWTECDVRRFLEHNLGLSKDRRIPGRIVQGHNEALHYWEEKIKKQELVVPFEVVHVDAHADLGLGNAAYVHIYDKMLGFPLEERRVHNKYDFLGNTKQEDIGDYLLYAFAYRWISKFTYCMNPFRGDHDIPAHLFKEFKDPLFCDPETRFDIQLVHNDNMKIADIYMAPHRRAEYLKTAMREPEIEATLIKTIEDVNFDGDYLCATIAQSPDYTPKTADYILEVFKEYIVEE